MSTKTAAEVFPPGDFVREELEARGWTQDDLAQILGRPQRLVSEVITGRRAISAETANALGEAFGTSAQFWMNLESAYRLHTQSPTDSAVARRARLYERAPVVAMVKRGWIEGSRTIDVLESRVLSFLGTKSLEEVPQVWPHAARKPAPYSGLTTHDVAWLLRARQLAQAVTVKERFTTHRLEQALARLRSYLHDTAEVRHIPRALAEAGIRFVVVQTIPRTRIDGACLWLDSKSPVVALSLRYDRIDYFWFTLLHELKHVANKDGLERIAGIDTDLVGKGAVRAEAKPAFERAADSFAAEYCIPKSELQGFVARMAPTYSKKSIRGFAARLEIHPGLVVGQLQHLGELQYFHCREMLVKVGDALRDAALHDGWGNAVPTEL